MRLRNGVRNMRVASWTSFRRKRLHLRIRIPSRALKSGPVSPHPKIEKTLALLCLLAKRYFLHPVSSEIGSIPGRLDSNARQEQEIEFFLTKQVASMACKESRNQRRNLASLR